MLISQGVFLFITSEDAYDALKDQTGFQASYDEKITVEFWLLRDLWQTTNMNYGAKWDLTPDPKS